MPNVAVVIMSRAGARRDAAIVNSCPPYRLAVNTGRRNIGGSSPRTGLTYDANSDIWVLGSWSWSNAPLEPTHERQYRERELAGGPSRRNENRDDRRAIEPYAILE